MRLVAVRGAAGGEDGEVDATERERVGGLHRETVIL